MNSAVDYHVHLSPDLTLDAAAELARSRGMQFGILEHPGEASGIVTDADLLAYVDRVHAKGLLVGLQPVHRGWAAAFGKDALASLDYVLMDADTLPLPDGSTMLIWRHDNFIRDVEGFMAAYWNHIMGILTEEPIQIFARPTYLPIPLARRYDELWTDEQMAQIIQVAVDRGIALEIAEQVRVPSERFVRMAKEAGATFTFGTNARNDNAGGFTYCRQVAEAVGLRDTDMLDL
jgi:hypothetical protein